MVTPFVLGDVELPSGTSILMPQWVVHRSERWWPEPERFDPDRWLGPDPARPRFAYVPFGGGPRVCVGNHFARMEAVLTLAVWMQAWSVRAVGPAPTLRPSVTLRPREGITIEVAARPSHTPEGSGSDP